MRCKKLHPWCQETSRVFDGLEHVYMGMIDFHLITSARTSFGSPFRCWSIWTSCLFYGNVYGFGPGWLIYWWKRWRSPEKRVLYRLVQVVNTNARTSSNQAQNQYFNINKDIYPWNDICLKYAQKLSKLM